MEILSRQIIEEYAKLDQDGSFEYNYNEENPFVIVYGWNTIKEFNEWAKNNYSPYLTLEVGMIRKPDDDCWIDFVTEGNWGFSDEWCFCTECNEPIQRQESPHWKWYEEGKHICSDCVMENYAEEYINDYLVINWGMGVPTTNIPINAIIPTETLIQFGFVKVKEDLEVGMYGTYDDPLKILIELTNQKHESDFIVHCTSKNPFATYYEVWERNDN